MDMDASESWPEHVRDRLLYIVSDHVSGRLTVDVYKSSVLKTGEYSSKARRYDTSRLSNFDTPKFVRPQDLRIITRIRVLGLVAYSGFYASGSDPAPQEIWSCLEMIVGTGRGRWKDPHGPALFMGADRHGKFAWQVLDDGSQKLGLVDEHGARLEALSANPATFIDAKTGEVGRLATEGPQGLFEVLLKSPTIPPRYLSEVTEALHDMAAAGVPQMARVGTEIRQGRRPVPELKLFLTTARKEDSRRWDPQSVRLPVLRLSFDYDGRRCEGGPGGEERFVEGEIAVTLLRDQQAEGEAYDRLQVAGARFIDDCDGRPGKGVRKSDLFFPDPDDDGYDDQIELDGSVLNFMSTVVPELKSQGWRIELSEDWPFRFYDGPVEIRADANEKPSATGNDWFSFDLNLQADGQRVDLIPTIVDLLAQLDFLDPDDPEWSETVGIVLENLRLYPQMQDGRFVALEAASLVPILKVFLSAVGLFDGFHRAEAGRVQDVVDALEGCQIPFDGGVELLTLGRRLQALGQTPEADPPPGFKGTLRPYQKQGYHWLCALDETGFGGILADDMGLGKTIQTLAFLASRYDHETERQKPTLLVVPTSLVHAWSRQAASFVPALKVLTLHGPSRKKDFGAIGHHHLVITTYALLHRDIDVLSAHQWQRIILDEAQNAKNPASSIAKSLRDIEADMRLALTGTPMENSLMDLWSIYDWLIPGLLGDRKTFRAHVLMPIEKHGDRRAQQLLNARMKPFILRRTKQQVAIDLPEKTEITELVPLGPRQSSLYEAVRLAMDERVRKTIAEKGLAASHITILDALLKLRQICCDPALLKHADKNSVTESAKRERLMELLGDLVSEGRRVLVFSQFVEMLDLIEGDIREKGWTFSRLTGATTKREKVVDAFQNGDNPIFLISLKAGGVGLTLTAADTVILYDPWWNPAVERQAMDRVHRIGQENKVFVYRLIAEGSVEQAISTLQERKQALADALFEGGEGNPFTFDEADISALFGPLEAV
jgi:superfamily II DNA or RNA helicase